MKSKAFVMMFAPSLHVSFEGKPWRIVIRRSDGQSHDPFNKYQGKEFTRKDIKKFIPNFSSLKWKKIELHEAGLDTCEMIAVDKDFRINLIREDKKLTAKEMLADFLGYLKQGA